MKWIVSISSSAPIRPISFLRCVFEPFPDYVDWKRATELEISTDLFSIDPTETKQTVFDQNVAVSILIVLLWLTLVRNNAVLSSKDVLFPA